MIYSDKCIRISIYIIEKNTAIMKINRAKKDTSKKILIIPIIITVILVGFFTYAYITKGSFFGWQPFGAKSSSVNFGPATEEEKNAGNATKDNTVNPETPDTTKPGNEQTTNPESPSTTTDVGLQITNKSFVNGNLHISTEILQVTSTGTCTLVLSKAGSSNVTQKVDVQPLASTSTCKGFDVPLSSLSNGTWAINLTYASTKSNGTVTDTVEVNL